ncbi:unnamed protein product [Rhizoctonia solani]|uniref:Uncharacterized protein n=1 Tax=Rhizoctonia solani TaxID=456999 RepID=A0A8H3GHU2_9AGAM|nr:uncharacterized protein RhiXN_08482 [Rhizoctonia solani]QRW23446.1 hypothetical protein RhiXN_08482 [Rhizoctonia solani]CAE6450710.1 unnamed protein product [Rhizoctonia solani]
MPLKLRSIAALMLLTGILYVTMESMETKIRDEIHSGKYGVLHWLYTGLSFAGGATCGYIITLTPIWNILQGWFFYLPEDDEHIDSTLDINPRGKMRDRSGAKKDQLKVDQSSLCVIEGARKIKSQGEPMASSS